MSVVPRVSGVADKSKLLMRDVRGAAYRCSLRALAIAHRADRRHGESKPPCRDRFVHPRRTRVPPIRYALSPSGRPEAFFSQKHGWQMSRMSREKTAAARAIPQGNARGDYATLRGRPLPEGIGVQHPILRAMFRADRWDARRRLARDARGRPALAHQAPLLPRAGATAASDAGRILQGDKKSRSSRPGRRLAIRIPARRLDR